MECLSEKTPARCLFGGTTHFLRLSAPPCVVETGSWPAAGPHHHISAASSGGLILLHGCEPLLTSAFSAVCTPGSEGLPRSVGNRNSVELELRSPASPGSSTSLPPPTSSDHAIEFIDLGKAVFIFSNSGSLSIDSQCNSQCSLAGARSMG